MKLNKTFYKFMRPIRSNLDGLKGEKTVVIKKNNKPAISSSIKRPVVASKKYVKAADDDFEEDNFDMDDLDDDTEGIMDAIDDVADNVEDLQDSIDEVKEDDVEIAMNNNIADHFIAECNRCNGIFISAVVDSDQVIDHVTGVCPLCGRETDQYLKWVIRSANE